MIQGASEGTEERGRETGRGRGSQRMGSRKDTEQEKDEGSSEIFNMVEGLYSGKRYLGKKGKPKKCKGIDRRI